MGETPRPLWELGLNWHTPWFGGTCGLSEKDILRLEARQECARELWAALRAWAADSENWLVMTDEHFRQCVLGVPPKEPAQKDRDR